MTGPQMTRYLSLQERLEELAKEDKRIEAAVILTYEFDPELIESLASRCLFLVVFSCVESCELGAWYMM